MESICQKDAECWVGGLMDRQDTPPLKDRDVVPAIAGDPAMARLHQHLDQVEDFLGEQADRERLQRVSAALYGQVLPEDWMEEVPKAQAMRNPSNPMTDLPVPLDRKGWLAWARQPYRHPTHAAAIEAITQGFRTQEVVDRKQFFRGFGLAAIPWVASVLVIQHGGPHHTTLATTIPAVCLLLVAVGVAITTIWRTPFFGGATWLTAVLEKYSPHHLTVEDLKRWGGDPALARQAIAWQQSEVGFLKGDADILKKSAKAKATLNSMDRQKIVDRTLWAGLKAQLSGNPDERRQP